MAVDIFLILSNDIKGETKDSVYLDKGIDIMSWSWGMSQSGTSQMGSGSGGGKVSAQDIILTKYVDASSSDIMFKCATGEHITNGKLIVRKAGGTQVEYFHINMEQVLVTSYQTGGSSDGLDRIMETVSLNASAFELVYVKQEADGTAGPDFPFGWSVAQNLEWTSVGVAQF